MENEITAKIIGTTNKVKLTGSLQKGTVLSLDAFLSECSMVRSFLDTYNFKDFGVVARFSSGESSAVLMVTISKDITPKNSLLLKVNNRRKAIDFSDKYDVAEISVLKDIISMLGEFDMETVSASVTIKDSSFRHDKKAKLWIKEAEEHIAEAHRCIQGGLMSQVQLVFVLDADAGKLGSFSRSLTMTISSTEPCSLIDALLNDIKREKRNALRFPGADTEAILAELWFQGIIASWLREQE